MVTRFEKDKVWFTADTHFYHGNILGFCRRPFSSVDEMNEVLIANWNSLVAPDDHVFHLGDFCLGGAGKWTGILDRLNGRIHLVLGNHDTQYLGKGFMDRFESVSTQELIEVDGQRILMCHYPFLCYDGAYDGVWQIFGHVHSGTGSEGLDIERLSILFPFQYDVGVDNNNYKPVSFRQLQDKIQSQVQAQ